MNIWHCNCKFNDDTLHYRVFLLAEGRVAFSGSVNDALNFFKRSAIKSFTRFFYINGVKQCFVCHILVISFVKGQRVIFIISRFRFFLLLSAYYESGNYNLISGPIFLWSNQQSLTISWYLKWWNVIIPSVTFYDIH